MSETPGAVATLETNVSAEQPTAEQELDLTGLESPQDEEFPETGEAEANAESEDGTEEVDGDGRTIPTKFRQLFKEHKELKNLWFVNQEYREHFASPADAEAAKLTIMELGGPEGIKSIESDRAALASIDQRLAQGDPDFVAEIAKQNPEGFSKIIPHALDNLARLDPEAYNHTMSRVFSSTFQQRGGLVDTLYEVSRNLQYGNTEQAKTILATVQKYVDGFTETANQKPTKRTDPDKDKFQTEKKQWEQQKAQEWTSKLQTEALTGIDNAVKKELGSYGKKYSGEAYQMFFTRTATEFAKMLKDDSNYQAQMKIHMGKMDKDSALKLHGSRMAKLLPLAVKKTYKLFNTEFGGKAAEQKKRVEVNNARKDVGSGGPVTERVAKAPDPKDIDSRYTTKAMIAKGEAILKNGKKVKF
jgi:hypothetical protein